MGQKGSKVQITENDRAILQLKRSRDEIHKFTRRTDLLISSERLKLKEMIKENPTKCKSDPRVRFLLKRIHYQDHLLQQALEQLINLENLVSTLEFKLVETQFIKGLERGNQILKKLNKEFENVDELMDDVQMQIAYQEEVDEVLAHSIVGVNDFETEIDKELDQMEREINPQQQIEMPSVDKLPDLKQRPIASSERKEQGKKEGTEAPVLA
ncbi:hypothetical protein HG536_0A04160 [Torulaspora globosa]|uniref:Vacuolar protein sorting-associated protein 20 n=1 Tax=Torulaspora globosa TaxID=48254 RepID=A0A7G3ZAR2_9SACH|nr:uncharacterized protein HG536_0A04160 [Torulaspora globosa]QLL30598.1 hypothetical protein HG536_0A04160 [Torulaspora globosa]